MKNLKVYILTVIIIVAGVYPTIAQNFTFKEITQKHPRLLLFDDELIDIKNNIEKDKYWRKLHESILKESDQIIALPTLERIQVGRRLLDKSREALRRIYFLGYSYRMTGEKKYFNRAEAELLKVSQFSDWNPSHFLDVAEMTLAVSIGYDWLYNELSETSKSIIKEAILKKGIEPSYDSQFNGFLTASNNWNQVCNAGMTYGAIAVYEHHPELAKKTIARSIESIKLSMKDYAPSGAYPEGEGYWTYGTSFNVLFISALEKIFNNDFGLTAMPGFLQTADYKQHMIGESGYGFNYSDAGSNRKVGFEPTIFWFANKTNKPSLIFEKDKYVTEGTFNLSDRIFPSVMIWGKSLSFENAQAPTNLFWQGDGKNPVALMRSSWTDPDAIFVGFKGGSPSVNHGHMDVGSFVMDALGERWALDLGMQDYESLESKGVKLWGKTQDSQRWEVLRYNNRYHNTLTFDDELQLVDGDSKIIQKTENPDFMSAVADLTPVYANKVKSAKRGVALIDKSVVVIKDEIETDKNARKLQWTMLTEAKVKIVNDDEIILTKNGKEISMKILSKSKFKFKTWSTDPVNSFDAENPGTIRVGFEIELEPNTNHDIVVLLAPKMKSIMVKQLSNWR